MRTFIATAAVAAAGLFSGVAAPAHAQTPGPCKVYKLPTSTLIKQSNGASFVLQFTNGRWSVAGDRSAEVSLPARVSTPRTFKFIITWRNGAGGVYTGSVDANGFVSGTTYDRWKPSSRASWNMRKVATCVY